MAPDLEPLPDDVPRTGLFAEPLSLTHATPVVDTVDDGATRVTFRVTVRDAEGKRGPDIAVRATIAGPDRTASGMAHTDLMGAVKFRMTGPPGSYRLTVDEVAGGALTVDQAAVRTAAVEAPGV